MSINPRTATSSASQSNDLRVRRTRRWLQDALIELMKEKPFQDIQIKELSWK